MSYKSNMEPPNCGPHHTLGHVLPLATYKKSCLATVFLFVLLWGENELEELMSWLHSAESSSESPVILSSQGEENGFEGGGERTREREASDEF